MCGHYFFAYIIPQENGAYSFRYIWSSVAKFNLHGNKEHYDKFTVYLYFRGRYFFIPKDFLESLVVELKV